MRAVGIISFSTLLALAASQPMVDKRDLEIVTEIVNVVKTIDVTTTIYVDAATPAPYSPVAHKPDTNNNHQAKPEHHGHHGNHDHHGSHGHHGHQHEHEHHNPPPHHPKYNHPPAHNPHKPKYPHRPAKPTTTAVPSPPPAYTPPPAPAYTPKPKPAPKPDNSPPPGAPVGDVHVGEMTHYAPGLGSCGMTNDGSEPIVALAIDMMNNPANPNLNPLCGTYITIDYQGKRHKAKVVDTCYACAKGDIDLSITLFQEVAPAGDGRVPNVKWWFNN